MATMKGVRIHSFGGLGAMRFEDLAVPRPYEGEILLKVHAASLNPVDFKILNGAFPPIGHDNLPVTLGRDVSGTVERCGPGIDKVGRGDPLYALLGTDRGAFAEYVVVKATEAAPKPARLSHVEAAAVPLAALTAWQGLFDHGRLLAGHRVLVHGGAGGVGHFAIQFAKHRGATVLTTVSGRDMDFALRLGADQVIDYKTQRFEEVASEVDVVFDLVGGDTRDRSWSVLKSGGILVSTLGQPAKTKADAYHVRAAGYLVQPDAAQLIEIGRLIDAEKVRPFVVQAVFPFSAAPQAEQRLQEGHVKGKMILEWAA